MVSKVIALASSKGGCAKSTTSINLVVRLSELGYKATLLDVDKQRTASKWGDRRDNKEELSKIHHSQKLGHIKTIIQDLKSTFDIIVVDTAGHSDSKEMKQALLYADLAVVPLAPSQSDYETIGDTLDLLDDARELMNENLKSLFFLNDCDTAPNSVLLNEVKTALANNPDVVVAETFVCHRTIYKKALSEGKGVSEYKDKANKKARDEVASLAEEVLKELGMKKYGIRQPNNKKTKKKSRKKYA